ncbi:MarR family winged helix-turn-helix transcriptional regulator [Kangiella koreensis]|uniref:Transcriptional regulator, MarR family n=1 Tax=Kangiella koreensis (strain DSM 16069 / JCM 12317 / KCTC 12182 / SW-125) TaxID=523791 RepID=C7RCT9_KANKD|nr:MarR family transcriptional regulator [Kangiella koreensis]ACV27081.1 transcriptional regulator, MarR family [Kangiella koreensis DSM 16069]
MPDSINKHSEVAEKLHRVAIYLLRNTKKHDQESGLTPERLSLLSILVYIGPQTINSLAEMEQVSAPAITRTVKSLEKQGYVIKSRSKTDQRVVYVAPTRKSQQLLDETQRKRVDRIEHLLEGAAEEDLKQLKAAMIILEKQIVNNVL